MKKVLVAILVLFLFAAIGFGGYFVYTKIIVPKQDEQVLQDQQQIDAMSGILGQPNPQPQEQTLVAESEVESTEPSTEDQIVKEDMEALEGSIDIEKFMELATILESMDLSDQPETEIRVIPVKVSEVENIDIMSDSYLEPLVQEVFGSHEKYESVKPIVMNMIRELATDDVVSEFKSNGITIGKFYVNVSDDRIELMYINVDKTSLLGSSYYDAIKIAEIELSGMLYDSTDDITNIMESYNYVYALFERPELVEYKDVLAQMFLGMEAMMEDLGEAFEESQSSNDVFKPAIEEEEEDSNIGETLGERGRL